MSQALLCLLALALLSLSCEGKDGCDGSCDYRTTYTYDSSI